MSSVERGNGFEFVAVQCFLYPFAVYTVVKVHIPAEQLDI
jgi:hypothetical protein